MKNLYRQRHTTLAFTTLTVKCCNHHIQHVTRLLALAAMHCKNLYPVLQYLGIRLKYCLLLKSPDKLALIERRFSVNATTSLDTALNDSEVKTYSYAHPHNRTLMKYALV